MRVGVVIGRIGGVDGVALETEKWVEVLRRLGHEVSILTGEVEMGYPGCDVVDELAFSHPDCVQMQDDAFLVQEADGGDLEARLEHQVASLAAALRSWIQARRVEVLLLENASTLPFHLSLGVALERVLREDQVPAVAHNHDFYWERGARYQTRFPGIAEAVRRCFPPLLPTVRHAVINSYCQGSLRRQHGVEATLVPNVMDFDEPFGVKDEVNAKMLADLGLDPGDIPLFQITRIVRRKGIETAIDLVHRLGDPRVKLVLTGRSTDDEKQVYTRELEAQVRRLGLEDQVLFAGQRFDARRGEDPDGRPVWALSDAYAHAAAMTYFSTYEGFGNAYVEALVAGVPIFVNRYEPVYWPDIGSKGFRTVEIQGGVLTDEAVEACAALLADPAKRQRWGEENRALGREHFSYPVLEAKLGALFGAG